MVISLVQGANDLHGPADVSGTSITSCFIKIEIGLTFLLPVYANCPGIWKRGVKPVSVCLSKVRKVY